MADSRSALEAEVARLSAALANALSQLSHSQEETRRLRRLLIPQDSVVRKRTREDSLSHSAAKRLRPMLDSASTMPLYESAVRSRDSKKSRSSSSRETFERRAESRRKVMTALVRDFSENCRPDYQRHLERERDQHFRNVDSGGKRYRLLR